MIYWFEVIYYRRDNPVSVSRYLAKIYCRLPNYANNLYHNAIDAFMRDINQKDEFEIQAVTFIKAVAM